MQELLDAAVAVVMTGGLQRETACWSASTAWAVRCSISAAASAHGITVTDGLTDVNAEVAEVKRPLVAMCREVVAVLDATKWGRVGVASFAALEDVTQVITTDGARSDLVAEVRSAGVGVLVV